MHQGWERNNTKVIYGEEMPDVAVWFAIKEIFPLKRMLFEGILFFVPKNPSHYLDALYEFDYRELLPVDKRTIHTHSIAILDQTKA